MSVADQQKMNNIVFYCKDCRKITDVKPVGKRYSYICRKCGTKNVGFGSEQSVKQFYHIKEEDEAAKTSGEKK